MGTPTKASKHKRKVGFDEFIVKSTIPSSQLGIKSALVDNQAFQRTHMIVVR